MAKKKVLLMGKAHSGKTSMRSIIFANYLARDTTRLSPTLDVEHHHVRFLGDLVLNLWDCGGQDAFFESYFDRDRETIFRSVELLIYVFDIESDCPEKDFDHFQGVLTAIEENSPDARIFVLVHKMDLVAQEDRLAILEERRLQIQECCIACGVQNFACFGTSIWDETLYKAWSEIVTKLIPNIGLLETHLNNFCRICDADEVVLFERATFLVISHAHCQSCVEMEQTSQKDNPAVTENVPTLDDGSLTIGQDETKTTDETPSGSVASSSQQQPQDEGNKVDSLLDNVHESTTNHHALQHFDAHRFEKISNIVKQFKLSCGKAQSQFQGMEVRNSNFSAFIDAFTVNTYIMVIVSNTDVVHSAATLLNIKNARPHFERLIPRV